MPSRTSSPADTSLRGDNSTELTLKDGQSSRISCFVKRPILFFIALLTVSNAEHLGSISVTRSSKSL